MPKQKLKKQSDQALLAEVKKEMAQPRAESTCSEDLNKGDPPTAPRSTKEKAMRNRWLAFFDAIIASRVVDRRYSHVGSGTTFSLVRTNRCRQKTSSRTDSGC